MWSLLLWCWLAMRMLLMMASIGLSAARDRLRGSSVAVVVAGGTADAADTDDAEAGFGRRVLDRRRGTVAASSLALLLVLASAPPLAPLCLTAPRPREAAAEDDAAEEDEAGWATRRSLRSPLEEDEDDDEDRSHRPLPLRRAAVADERDEDDEFDERDDDEEGAGLVPGGFRRQVRSSFSSPSLEEAESP